MTTVSSNPQIHGSHYPNGNWKSQNFCDKGSRSGYQVTWYENGNMKSSGDFENNKPTGLHALWFDNGTKRAEINYEGGIRDGEFTFWYRDGQIKSQGGYLSGQVVGTWTVWHSNGQKYKETDTINGTRLYWYDNGQMKSRQWCISDKNEYMPNRNWDKKGNFIDSWIITLAGAEYHIKKKNHIQKLTHYFTYAFTRFKKNGFKEYETGWCWSDLLDNEKDGYGVDVYNFFNNNGEINYSIRFYEETIDDSDSEEFFKPYSWCFYDIKDDSYNAKDNLIYEYIIDQDTYEDINLYDELLKIDNKELNKILVQIQKHKSIFDKEINQL